VNKNFLAICSTTGQIGINNVTISELPFTKVFPAGNYAIAVVVSDDLDANLLKLNISFNIIK
jgi:hypothetical protein